MYLAAGLVVCAVAVPVEGPVATAVGVVVVGVTFGTGMYLLVYRRFARDAVRDPTAPVTTLREPPRQTRRRAAVATLPVMVLMAAAAVALGTPSVVGGTGIGNGAAMLLTGRWLHSWERAHRRRLLREPRWRWSGRRGWGRGRGMMDAQDIYAEPL